MKVKALVALFCLLACQAFLCAAAERKATLSKGPFMKDWIANAKKKFGSKVVPGTNPKKPVTYNNISQTISGAGAASDVPFFVALDVGTKVCGGALIHEKYVITVSGCTYALSAGSTFTAVFGYNDDGQATNRQSATVKTDDISYPPDINLMSDLSWVTLIKITTPLTINNYVKPILVNPDDYEFPNFIVSYCGLGTTSGMSLVFPTQVQEKQTTIQTQENCGANTGGTYKRDLHICTSVGTDGSGPCYNDEGGPLYYYDSGPKTDVLIGLVSMQFDLGESYCPFPNFMSKFTRVSKFICWLEEASGNELVISKEGQCPAPAECGEKRRLKAKRMSKKIPKTPKTPAKAKPKKN